MTVATTPHQSKQLLLVDDDRLVLATLASGLTLAGYRVSTAESAEEAEAWLAGGERPDLAILDVRMPGQGGLYLAQRLRELDHIPFMMLSAFNDPDLVQQATQIGALGYALKPLQIPQLIPAIEAALARSLELKGLLQTRQQLQTALAQERDINMATGITMMQHRQPRKAAFEMLRTAARSRRIKLADLAAEVIQSAEKLNLGNK